MWYEYNKILYNLSLIRRVFIAEGGQLALVFSEEDKMYLTYATAVELYEAYDMIKAAVVNPTMAGLYDIHGNL